MPVLRNKQTLRLGVFASSRGTDLQAILNAKSRGELPFLDLRLVLSDKEDAFALERARRAGVKACFLNPKGMNRAAYDKACLKICQENGVEVIFLIGYMRIVSSVLIRPFQGRIFNIHPSLLPKYPGMDLQVHAEVIRNGEKESGCTLHYVTEELDGGPVFLQEKVPISENETVESLKEKVQLAEQKVLLAALNQLASQISIPVSGL
jgi:phosphoribosylglycinamide formyltransferase-1